MFSPTGFYSRTRNLRVRPIPEMAACFVFTPETPRLYTLNAAAWLALELCDGRNGKALETAYVDALRRRLSRKEARAELRRIVGDLERKGIIEHRTRA